MWWRKTREAAEVLAQKFMDDEKFEMLDNPEIKEVEVPLDEEGFAEFLNENAYCDHHMKDVINK